MRAGDAKLMLREAPLRSFDEIVGDRPLLVLAPHPDDESLGCGGLIAEACGRGHPVWVAILTDGGMSHPNSASWPRDRLVAARMREAEQAVRCLGLDAGRLIFLGEPDSRAPTEGPAFEALVDRLRSMIVRHNIGMLAASWIADPHGDHVAAAMAAAAACELAGAGHISYPVWSWTLPDQADVPDPSGRAMRLDISRHLHGKRQAIASHATQHAGLINDDPTGFSLPAGFLAQFDEPTEVFISEP